MYLFPLNLFRKPIFFILLFLTATTASTQKVWTLEDCINYAFENNLDITKQVLNVELNKAQFLQSKLIMLPSINANGTNIWNYGMTVDRYTNQFATSTVRSNNFNLSANMTLFNGLTLVNSYQQNKINLLASNYDLDVIKNNISLAVAGYYLDILFSMELLDVAKNQLDITADQVNRIKKLVEAGSSAKGDLLNIEAQSSAEELTVVDAENRLFISRLRTLRKESAFMNNITQLHYSWNGGKKHWEHETNCQNFSPKTDTNKILLDLFPRRDVLLFSKGRRNYHKTLIIDFSRWIVPLVKGEWKRIRR